MLANAYGARLEAGLGFSAFARIRGIRLYPMYFLGLTIGLAQYWASVQSGGAQSGAWSTTAAIISGLLMIPISYSFTSGYGYNAIQGLLYPFNAPARALFCELTINALSAFFRPRGRALFLLSLGQCSRLAQLRSPRVTPAVGAATLWAAVW